MKRSTHIGLVVLTAAGIGGAAYALQPRNCPPPAPGTAGNNAVPGAAANSAAAPGTPPQRCSSVRYGTSGYGTSSYGHNYWHLFPGSGSSGSSATSLVSSSGASGSSFGSAVRGGFGSIGHAFGSFGGGS